MSSKRKAARGNRSSSSSQPTPPTADPRPTALVYALLVAVTLAAYYPAWHGGLLWDDDVHVTTPDLRSADGLRRIWLDVGATKQYYPIVHSGFWFLHAVFGDDLLGYHLVNIVLHATSAFLFAAILTRLAVPGGIVAAFLFALHPVHVESVAWVTELKNTLSGVFFLASALVYLRFDVERRPAGYALAVALFVCALLSKSVTAVLPGVLLVVFWWQRGRLRWREDVLPLVPFAAAGAVSGLATAWLERVQIGAEGAAYQFTVVERCLIAGRALWFYAGKLIWPANLIFSYPRWQVSQSVWWQYLPPIGVLLVAAAAWAWRGRSRAPLASLLLFAGLLFPALGFFNVYPFVFSFVADHFAYLPSLGLIAGLAAGAATVAARDARLGRVAPAAAGVLLIALGALTWRQSRIYRDAPTLYEATLARNPDCYLCLNNLGTLAARGGEMEEAARFYREAVRIKPDSPEAHNNLGSALAQSGKMAESLPHFEQAVRAAPNYVSARVNFGGVLFRMGRVAEAKAQFEAALRVMPDYGPARQNLAVIERLEAQGRPAP